ncbi:MAG TPA: primosomal protein N' [Nitrospiraceae bacterium]|nr:primosomal protein N' [Nitrospiraceae bacterium]
MISTPTAPSRTEPEALFADVIVPRHLAGPFTYIVSSSLRPTLRIGHRVLVPFGRSILQGAVIALSHVLPQGLDRARLKEICSLLPEGTATDVPSNLFELSRKVAEQYVAPWGQCLRLVLPPALKPRAQVIHYKLTEQGLAALATREPCSVKSRALLTRLRKKPLGLRRSSLSPGPADLLHDLKSRGWVEEVKDLHITSAAPLTRLTRQTNQGHFSATPPFLPDPASSWAEPLFEALRGQGPTRILVQASWADRLRLLQQAVRLVLDHGQTVLIIVGEAERAQWIAGLIRHDESDISPICFHSGLSDQVRAEMWDQIHRQIVRVVVGTRSAIFLPLTTIGAIWVEGEDDAALKEPQEPRYHARDVAWLRAQGEQAVLVLSSAHPSLEIRAAVEQRGIVIHKLIPPDTRPNVQVVELRDHGRGTVLSQPLIRAIGQAIDRRAGILLFLNRKGYAGALVCRDCGQVPRCPACRVAMMYSRQAGRLLCSYCGGVTPLPETCVSCSGPRMQLIGEGTERVEEDAKRWFPLATVIRLDGDTMRRPAQAEALWQRVEQGKWDIIVGTQLLLRRGPLPTMGLVGIVQADAGLSVPNFQSAERTYHTLLDAVSLAAPAGAGGQVILQTYLSSHHAIQAVAQNDESVFLSEELSHRAALGFPPMVHLIALLVSGTDEKMIRDAATAWVARLTACSSSSAMTGQTSTMKTPLTVQSISRPDRLTVLGPAPSPVPRLRGRYRWQILVKSSEREEGLAVVRTTVKEMERTYQRRVVKFDIDVDPIEMW